MAASVMQPGSTWAEHRLRARLFWIVLLLGPVAAFVLGVMHLVPRYGAGSLLWPALAWAAAVLMAGLYWQRFRCPCCDKTFYKQSPPLLALRASHCRACMLPEGH